MRNVLIVEESELFAHLYRSLLPSLDCICMHVRNLASAARLVEQEPPDLIVIGLRFPDTTTIAAVRAVRRRRGPQQTPVIAITIGATTADEDALRAVGCQVVPRPLSVAEFMKFATDHLKRPAGQLEADAAAPADEPAISDTCVGRGDALPVNGPTEVCDHSPCVASPRVPARQALGEAGQHRATSAPRRLRRVPAAANGLLLGLFGVFGIVRRHANAQSRHPSGTRAPGRSRRRDGAPS